MMSKKIDGSSTDYSNAFEKQNKSDGETHDKRHLMLKCMLLFDALDIVEECLKPPADKEKEG